MKLNKFTKLVMSLSVLGMLAGCGTDESTREATKDITQNAIDTTTQYVKDNKDSWKSKLGDAVGKLDDVVGGVMDGIDSASKGSDSSNTNSAESGDFADTASVLATYDFQTGTPIDVDVNGGVSTLDFNDWDGPKIDYSDLDNLNRAQTATAHLTKENYGKSEGREGQKWEPTGWNNQEKKIDGKKVRPMDRGHLIAYTLSFNLDDWGQPAIGEDGSIDNPRNLFSQTSASNRGAFQKYEGQIRNAIQSGEDVLYRVEPIYRDNELMARGVWAQAISSDGNVNFNAYIYNVQPNFSFDYSTGRSTVDKDIQIAK